MKKKKLNDKTKKHLKTAKDFKKFAGILKGDVIGELMKEKKIEREL